MQRDSEFGPAYSPDMFRPDGRLRFFCKGSDSGAAIKEQRLAREQSAMQFQQQMALQQKQFDAAAAIKPITFAPASPLAQGDPDTYAAGLDAKRAQKRRYGPSATRLASAQTSAIPMGAVPLAA